MQKFLIGILIIVVVILSHNNIKLNKEVELIAEKQQWIIYTELKNQADISTNIIDNLREQSELNKNFQYQIAELVKINKIILEILKVNKTPKNKNEK